MGMTVAAFDDYKNFIMNRSTEDRASGAFEQKLAESFKIARPATVAQVNWERIL